MSMSMSMSMSKTLPVELEPRHLVSYQNHVAADVRRLTLVGTGKIRGQIGPPPSLWSRSQCLGDRPQQPIVLRPQVFVMKTLLHISLLLWAWATQAQTVLYVATNGNDGWTGHVANPNTARTDGPLATLEGARNILRGLKSASTLTNGATVLVRGGNYYRTNTFNLEARDSGISSNAPIVYRAYPGEKPALIGGLPITNFVRWKGEILKSDVGAQGFKGVYFRQLFCDNKRQPLARYPNRNPEHPVTGGWAYADGKWVTIWTTVPGEDKHSLRFKPADARTWAHPEEGEVFVFPRYNWWNNIVRIKEINSEQRLVTLASDCSYAIRPGDRYYVQNLIEELDAPGEWYLDKRTWTLYLWPPIPHLGTTVCAPVIRTILNLGPGAAHVGFRGFTLECCAGTAIRMEAATNCWIAESIIRNVGDANGSGVAIAGGFHNGVTGCDISETGSNGVDISGGDQKTLTGSENYADNNHIHSTGVFFKQSAGVAVSGVGAIVSHNLIHDTPRMGILFWGNRHIIEFNHVHHVNLETQDSGIIYTGGRDWIGGRGCVIRYNFFHDSLGYGQRPDGTWESPHNTVGIYLDDNAGGVDVIGNIVARCPLNLINVHNGRDNLIENNILVDGPSHQVIYTGWTGTDPSWANFLPQMVKGYESVKNAPAWKSMRNMNLHPTNAVLGDGTIMAGNVFRRNILSYSAPEALLWSFSRVNLDHYVSDSNLVYHSKAPKIETSGTKGRTVTVTWTNWQALGFDQHSVLADPLFVSATKDDYRIRPGSPALQMGFLPIPIERIGQYPSSLRAELSAAPVR
jgi:hypothetical protein